MTTLEEWEEEAIDQETFAESELKRLRKVLNPEIFNLSKRILKLIELIRKKDEALKYIAEKSDDLRGSDTAAEAISLTQELGREE